MGKHLSYNFHIWKNAYHRVFIQFSVRMELYEIVWQEVSHIWKLYDKKFWSTRVFEKNIYWNTIRFELEAIIVHDFVGIELENSFQRT